MLKYIFCGPVTCDSSKAAAVVAINHIAGAITDNTHRTDGEIYVHLNVKGRGAGMNISQSSKLEKEMEEMDELIKKIPRLGICTSLGRVMKGQVSLQNLGVEEKT